MLRQLIQTIQLLIMELLLIAEHPIGHLLQVETAELTRLEVGHLENINLFLIKL